MPQPEKGEGVFLVDARLGCNSNDIEATFAVATVNLDKLRKGFPCVRLVGRPYEEELQQLGFVGEKKGEGVVVQALEGNRFAIEADKFPGNEFAPITPFDWATENLGGRRPNGFATKNMVNCGTQVVKVNFAQIDSVVYATSVTQAPILIKKKNMRCNQRLIGP